MIATTLPRYTSRQRDAQHAVYFARRRRRLPPSCVRTATAAAKIHHVLFSAM
jgi:hypothetical protein